MNTRKKRARRLWAAAMIALCSFGAVSCQAEEPDYTVGICQFAGHASLDSATQGFQDALTEKLGDRVSFTVKNAQGDFSACTIAINTLVSENVDLILANSTTALQTAVTATDTIPILGTSVTEYGAALQIEEFDGLPGTNVSGTSDLAPLDGLADVVKELFPDAARVGLLYCSAEPNSQYQIHVMQENLEALGYECGVYSFSDSNELSPVTLIAASECDVLYVPTDNAVASNTELISNICDPERVPVITGDESTCLRCGVATLSIDYYDLGYTTGNMAARILADGEDISKMPIEFASEYTKKYNKERCESLGIEVPDDYLPLE